MAVNRAFADVAAYHASHGIKSLPAFLEARATRAESLHDLTGAAPPNPQTIQRCRDCGVDLTFDEEGQHCPVCGLRTSGT
jgi:rubrerythrin